MEDTTRGGHARRPTPGVTWRIAPGEVVMVALDAGVAVVTDAAHALYRRGPVTWSRHAAGGQGLGRLTRRPPCRTWRTRRPRVR